MAFDFSNLRSLLPQKEVVKTAVTSVIGIDVGASAIKIVQLRNNKGVPTLDTYGELQLGPYGGVEIGRIANLKTEKLTEILVDILRESSATSKHAAIAVSHNSSFVTIVPVLSTDQEQIASMIPVEARKYVPISLNEVSLDWFPISASEEGGSTKVLLAAIHNSGLKKMQDTVKGAGLTTETTEIELFSTIRSSASQKADTVAIVDLGAGSTKLYIAQNGVVVRTHSLRMNASTFTTEIAKSLTLSFEEAESLKREVGLTGSGDDARVKKVLTPHLQKGFRELDQVIKQYVSEEEVTVEEVILSGDGALLKGLQEYVKDILGLPVVLADPFSKVAYPAFLEDTLKEAGPAFAVAIGSALRVLQEQGNG